MNQSILDVQGNYSILDSWFHQTKCCMLVCGKSIKRLKIYNYLKEVPLRFGMKMVHFMEFQTNPLYENIVKGVKIFREEKCDAIVAVGGGSAMDVAKCIKLYSNLPGDGVGGSWLRATITPNKVPLLVMPTTSGTGAEATRFAVIYYKGVKQSVSDYSCIPGTVLLDSSVLKTLPEYQRKATMCDALCHAIESFWSLNSTEESKLYSKKAIQGVIKYMPRYLANDDKGNAEMLIAANMAGKAINIAQTTAGHAMSYKITSLFGIAHGHATIICNRMLFPWMVKNTNRCIDPRGEEYLKCTLKEIGQAMGCEDAETGSKKLAEIFDALELEIPLASDEQFEELKTSVNLVRLKNQPISLDVKIIDALYHESLRKL